MLNKKNVKLTKRVHDFKGFASSYNVEILNSFNPKLQLKDTASANKNKLDKLLTELRGFKFTTTLVLVFKEIESEDKTKCDTFYSNSKVEIIISNSDVDDLFEWIYTKIISNIQKKVQAGLLIQSLFILLVFQNIIP